MSIKNMTHNAILAAVYVCLTIVNPAGYGVFQFRTSEILVILPIFKRRFRGGILLGVAIANMFSPLGIIDVFCGVLVQAIFYYAIDYICDNSTFTRRGAKYLLFSAGVGVIIGAELAFVYGAPFGLTFFTTMVPEIIMCAIGDVVFSKVMKYGRDTEEGGSAKEEGKTRAV